MDDVFVFIGKLISYGGGSAVIAYALFQWLGKSWIENKFNQNLEQLRHDQALELKRLRVEIESLLSGAIKLQEHEFSVLPEAWGKLDEAYSQVSQLTSPFQEYPDLDNAPTDKIEEFLSTAEFYETQKEEIRRSDNKSQTYQEIEFWFRLNKVQDTFSDYQKYISKNCIFFTPETKDKFSAMTESLYSALTSKEIGFKVKDYKMQREGWQKLKEDSQPLFKDIQNEIQARLNSHANPITPSYKPDVK